jgi:hypothetical protein
MCGFETIEIRENGGPFVAISGILDFLPLEMFSVSAEREHALGNWLKYGIHFTALMILAPLTFALLALDFVYPHKNFTNGYVVLLRSRGDAESTGAHPGVGGSAGE